MPSFIIAGTVIGAGMFGLPYAFREAGFSTGFFYLLFLAGLISVLKIAYASIIVHTPGDHRLVGYAEAWLGKKGFVAASIVNIVGLFGTLLVYLVLGYEFLAWLMGGAQGVIFYTWILFSIALIFGVRLFRLFEWGLVIMMVALMAVVFVFGLPGFTSNYEVGSISGLALLYGIGLFSLSGTAAIPEIKDYLINKKKIISIILAGIFIPTIFYFLFVVGVWGLSDGNVSRDALSGIVQFPFLKKIGYVLGFLALATSYWTVSINFKNVLYLDYKLSKLLSVMVVLGAPVAVSIFAQGDFIGLMSFVGSIAAGLQAILILSLYLIVTKHVVHPVVKLPKFLVVIVGLFFAIGVVYHLII